MHWRTTFTALSLAVLFSAPAFAVAPILKLLQGPAGAGTCNVTVRIMVDPASNVLLAGVLQGSADFGLGPLTSAGSDDVFVVKLAP